MAKKNTAEQTNESQVENESTATAPITAERQIELDKEHAATLMKAHGNVKSTVIRILFKEWAANKDDMKVRSRIAKSMGIVYQHVRNVLVTPVKKTAEAPKSVENSSTVA